MLAIIEAYKLKDLLDQRFFSASQTVFTFPQTLGALFFGTSLAVFYSTFKSVGRSQLAVPRKIWAFVAIDLLFILGVVAHVLDVNDAHLFTSSYNFSGEDYINISVYNEHTQFIPRLHGFIVIFTGWVAAHMLALRAYVLTGRTRWFGILLAFLLVAMFITQLVLYSLGFNAAWPSHPIINLVIQVPVTLAVLHNTFTRARESKKGVICAIEDVLTDSGAILTVGLILQTIFPFAGVSFEPINALLPHVQNITACVILSRLIDGETAGGALRLESEESIAAATGVQADPAL